jgi:acyl dehydratase
VRAGDRLRAQWECLSKRPSASDPTRGIVEFRYTLLNHRGQVAWTCRSINLIETGPRTVA